jgi:hypothetical protein
MCGDANIHCAWILMVYGMWESMYEKLCSMRVFDENLYRKLAECYIEENLRGIIGEVDKYVHLYNDFCDDVKIILNSPHIIHTKQLSHFLEDPMNHIIDVFMKKAFNLISMGVDVDKFASSINLTIKKCIDVNFKMIFQNFVALSIPYNLHSHNPKIVYPKNGWIILSRKGVQNNDSLPPNYVLEIDGRRFSFFIEAPRPIDWSRKVRKSSKIPLHAAPRPDIMIYRGFVKNILKNKDRRVKMDSIIKRPYIIIECKEVEGWWKSSRLSKGIRNLTNGELENVKALDVVEVYQSLYRPKKAFVVSMVKAPRGVKYKLGLRGIETIDDTGFNPFMLSTLSNALLNGV